VADAIRSCPGVEDAVVYGIQVPGTDGRAGMAALVVADGFDLRELGTRLRHDLPHYARPLFLRILPAMPLTATFKSNKSQLIAEGFDPGSTGAVFLEDHLTGTYIPFDQGLHAQLLAGAVRV
jgi:fatty-acyl-CoA synthase